MLKNGGAYSKPTCVCKARSGQKFAPTKLLLAIAAMLHHIGSRDTVIAARRGPAFQAETMSERRNLRDDEEILTSAPGEEDVADPRPVRVTIMGREIVLPRSRALRIALGVGLVALGIFGFLPVLGFWMIPLGLLVLSYEFAAVRRRRRKFVVWWNRRNGNTRNGK